MQARANQPRPDRPLLEAATPTMTAKINHTLAYSIFLLPIRNMNGLHFTGRKNLRKRCRVCAALIVA